MTMTVWVLAAAVAAGLATLVWWAVRVWPRRWRRWEEAAAMLGLALAEEPPLHERFGALDYFRQGRARRTRALLEGEGWRGKVFLGDHEYTTGSGQYSSQHRHAVCVVQGPRLALPHFSLRQEIVLLDRLAELFGGGDIDFEEDPEFSRTFRLRGSDAAAVRKVFSPAVRHFGLHSAGSKVIVEGREDLLLVHWSRLVRPEDATTLLQQAQELAQLLTA